MADITVSLTGLYGTGQVGNASTDVLFDATGVYGTGEVGSVALWFNVNTTQASTWAGVDSLQR